MLNEAKTVFADTIPHLKECEVVFILPHLGPGGAQRVATLTLNNWSRQGLKVGLITTLDNKPDAHKLDDKVLRVHLTKVDTSQAVSSNEPETYVNYAVRNSKYIYRSLRNSYGKMIRLVKSYRENTVPSDNKRANSSQTLFADAILYPRAALTKIAHITNYFVTTCVFQVLMLPVRLYFYCYTIAKIIFKFLQPTIIQVLIASERYGVLLGVKENDTVQLMCFRFLAGKRESKLRQILRYSTPPRVLSFLTKTNILTVLSARGLPTRVVISERNDPDLQKLEPVWEEMRSFTYQRADMATSNSLGVLEKMYRFVGNTPLKLLPNPLVVPSRDGVLLVRQPRFVIVARLVHQKAIDILLTAFREVSDEIPEWELDIVGDGPLRAELQALSKELGIAEKVVFHGHVPSSAELLSRASVFVLPSRFEGMPNSLLEAMANGLPSIVSDSSPGPLEVVEHQKTGLIVPVEDVIALSDALLCLAKDEAVRIRLGNAAQELVRCHEWSSVEGTWREVLGMP